MGAMLAGGVAAAGAAYGAHHLSHGSHGHYAHGAHMPHGKFKQHGHGKFKHGKHGKFKHGKHGKFGKHGGGFKKWKWGLYMLNHVSIMLLCVELFAFAL